MILQQFEVSVVKMVFKSPSTWFYYYIYKGKLRIILKTLIFIIGKCYELTPFEDVLGDLKNIFTMELQTVVKS